MGIYGDMVPFVETDITQVTSQLYADVGRYLYASYFRCSYDQLQDEE